MLQLILDLLKDPLTFLSEFIAAHGALTYGLLFLIVFVESGLVVMPFLPGDSLLFSVGLLAAASGELSLGTVIPLLIAAALLGDQVNYFIGKYFSGIIREREKVLFLKREHISPFRSRSWTHVLSGLFAVWFFRSDTLGEQYFYGGLFFRG